MAAVAAATAAADFHQLFLLKTKTIVSFF